MKKEKGSTILIMVMVVSLWVISGQMKMGWAQWVNPNLFYPLPGWYGEGLRPIFPLAWPEVNLNFNANFFYPQISPFIFSSFPYSQFSLASLLFNPWSLQNSWSGQIKRGSRTASSNSAPVRQTPALELRQVKYSEPAIIKAVTSYIPGIPGYVPNQVIAQFLPGTSALEVSRVCANHQCHYLYTSPYAGYTLLSISPSTTVVQAALRLQTEASVIFAEPNYYRQGHLIPNDPYYRYQWHLSHLNTNYAWDIVSGSGAVVALLDSGVAFENNGVFTLAPDLAGTLFIPGYDFINDDLYPDDDYGHGTHMAGCIAQTTGNLLGVAGVAYNAGIMPVKIMDSIGGVVITDEVDGIYYAANNGANIINMSLGGPGTSATEAAAITYAYNNGVTVICSAGNSASGTPEYPASYPEPVSVSSIRYDYTFASGYSNYGLYVDVCAPGGDLSQDLNLDGFGDGILQETHDGTNYSTFSYYFLEGTSPASALVSGVAALIVSKSTTPIAPANVVSLLESTAKDLGTAGWDQYYGYGLVNAYSAVLQTP